METWYYEVVSIDGDYANLKRTDIESDDLKLVARALLPENIGEGSKLKQERNDSMEEQIKEKRVADSLTEQFHEIRPEHLNGADVMFGGILMGWIDEVAGLTAMRHSEGHVLTASVDNLTFLRSLRQHDIVVLIGRVTYVGNSSMEIRVDSYLEKIDGMRYPVNRAYLTLVALDEDNKPRRVPRLKLETVVEEAEWETGKKRSELRKQRKKEGF